MNATLRAQLDAATNNGDKLLADVNKLTDNWDRLNDELLEKEKNVRNEGCNINTLISLFLRHYLCN